VGISKELPVKCNECGTTYDELQGKCRKHKFIDWIISININKIPIRFRRKKNGING